MASGMDMIQMFVWSAGVPVRGGDPLLVAVSISGASSVYASSKENPSRNLDERLADVPRRPKSGGKQRADDPRRPQGRIRCSSSAHVGRDLSSRLPRVEPLVPLECRVRALPVVRRRLWTTLPLPATSTRDPDRASFASELKGKRGSVLIGVAPPGVVRR